MLKDLKSFAREHLSSNEKVKTEEKSTVKPSAQNEKQNIEALLNKYKGRSQTDLIGEFFKQIEEKKKAGTFNQAEIDKVVKQLSPMLNEQQRQMLYSIIGSI